MKMNRMLVFLIVLAIVAYFTQSYWMPSSSNPDTPSDSTFVNNGCVTVTAPAVNAEITLPLTITATIDYGCRVIFEAQAGVVWLYQNDELVSVIDANTDNGLLMVQGAYYEEINYPVTAQATISNLQSNITGPVDLVIMPENPCGDGPECPASPAPIVVPVMLP